MPNYTATAERFTVDEHRFMLEGRRHEYVLIADRRAVAFDIIRQLDAMDPNRGVEFISYDSERDVLRIGISNGVAAALRQAAGR